MNNQREDALAWMREHSERLAEDLDALHPRVRVRCEKGCPILDVYDHPDRRIGSVVLKRRTRRAEDHAEREASSMTSSSLVAPVEALITAAGNGPIGLVFSCERHIEASISPDALRWLARRKGRTIVHFRDLVDREDFPWSQMDVRRAPGLTGGTVTVVPEPLDMDNGSSTV